MNRSRTTTTTETYTAHYNLSRTSEGASLKGPFKTWNPQPHYLVSESETESAPKRHPSHTRTAHNAPSTHPAAANPNYPTYQPMSNSRTAPSSHLHQRVSSPAPHRPDHTTHGYPMEPPQQPPPPPKQNSSVLNFIRPHMKEVKTENASTRRGDDLHRTAITNSKYHPSSSYGASQAARAAAPPVSYSSPSSAEPSPRNSTDSGHQPANNVSSDNESRRHHHSIWNPYVDSKLYAEYGSRKIDTSLSAQEIAEKKAKDRQDMVAKVAEAFSPPMSSRPRVPETISLGQLSLLRADDASSSRRTTSTGKTSESRSRSQAYPQQTMPSQSRQRSVPQELDPGTAIDPQSKSHRQTRPPTEIPARTQPTPTPAVPQSKPVSVPTSKAPPPPSAKSPVSTRTPFLAHFVTKKPQSSSRAAANPWPFNHASSAERTASKQSSKEQPRGSTRMPTTSNTTNPPSSAPHPDIVHSVPPYSRESSQPSKVLPRDSGPPVPPKQVVNPTLPGKPPTEEVNTRDLPSSSYKPTTSRTMGNIGPETQTGFAPHPPMATLPSSSVRPAVQAPHVSKPKPEFQVQPDHNPALVSTTSPQIKSPVTAPQTSMRSLSKSIPSTAIVPVPVPTPVPNHHPVAASSAQQMTARSSATPKLPAVPADLSLALVPAEPLVNHQKLHERFPIQEKENPVPLALEAPPSFDDPDRLALVRPEVLDPRNAPTVPIKETLITPGPTADTDKQELALTRVTAPNHSQSNSGKSTPGEINQQNAPIHIQWIPPAEAETSSLSSDEEDDTVPQGYFSNAVSQASVAAGVWTTSHKVALRPGEMSYASQAPNLYVVPQKLSRSNPPTPPEPDNIPDVSIRSPVPIDVPNKTPSSADISSKTTASNGERPVAGAWTTKAISNNVSNASTALETLPKPPSKPYENVVSTSRSATAARPNGDTINNRLLSIQAAPTTTTTPNGSSVGMTPGAWTTVAKYNKPTTTIFESDKKNEPFAVNAVAANGQMSSTMRQALNGSVPVAGAWTTKASQPEIQTLQHSNSNTTTAKPTPPRNTSPPSATPKYQMTPATGSGSNTPSSAEHHSSGTAATSHIDRVPISGHPSTPAPSRPSLRQTPPPLSIASTTPDTDSLLTPSSLNSPRSTLLVTQPPPPPVPVTITPPQPPMDKEKSSKNRILDFFRPKQAVAVPSYDVPLTSKRSSKETERTYADKKESPPPIFSQPKTKPVTATIPPQSHPPPRPKSPKLFSSLKLFSRRNRTVSTASMDALDGTTTTVMNSPSSSAPEIPGAPSPPPLRDPFLATQEWLDNEANQFTRGKRPHRPGVTFDCADDIAPIHMVPSRYKLSRSYYNEDDEF